MLLAAQRAKQRMPVAKVEPGNLVDRRRSLVCCRLPLRRKCLGELTDFALCTRRQH